MARLIYPDYLCENATMTSAYIRIHLATQKLQLLQHTSLRHEFNVSTAKNGAGETFGSECTPRGKMKIRAKIGADCKTNTVFIGRRPTGEIYNTTLANQFPQRDWILTRILWLTGLEPGFNRYGKVDTLRRFIYIHGTPDSKPMGIPLSHGCIRMRNAHVMQLFYLVEIGTMVDVFEF